MNTNSINEAAQHVMESVESGKQKLQSASYEAATNLSSSARDMVDLIQSWTNDLLPQLLGRFGLTTMRNASVARSGGFFAGFVAGAATSALLTPVSGPELRQKIVAATNKLTTDLIQKKKSRGHAEKGAREAVDESKKTVSRAVKN